jgi:transposase
MSLKKTLKASEQDREDIAAHREAWRGFQEETDAGRLVFLDETGFSTNMSRLYGRAHERARCYDTAPCGRWKTVTLLSAVRLDGTTESVVFEGAPDRKMFDVYIKRILAPSLRPGDILVMDNLSVHKSPVAEAEVALRRAEIRYLPAYSPDLNPIERMWSKLKQLLRGMKARTHEDLFLAVRTALKQVSKSDARGWFQSCGYALYKS